MFDRDMRQSCFSHCARQRWAFTNVFYANYGKRALDVVLAAAGLVLLAPFLALVACLVKMTSHGPVFFRQFRVGRHGRQFQILKFRSMVVNKTATHLDITVAGDARITSMGRVVRRYKIDELPQLWNVLCGDMSLVGPRPESPVYVAEYPAEHGVICSVRPGITGPASLAYRNEEQILAGHDDPDQFYRTHILPDKLARNIAYLKGVSFGGDLRVIFNTIRTALLPSDDQV